MVGYQIKKTTVSTISFNYYISASSNTLPQYYPSNVFFGPSRGLRPIWYDRVLYSMMVYRLFCLTPLPSPPKPLTEGSHGAAPLSRSRSEKGWYVQTTGCQYSLLSIAYI